VVRFTLRPLCHRRKSRGTHWIGAWVSPRAGQDTMAKRKKSHHCLCWEMRPGRPAHT